MEWDFMLEFMTDLENGHIAMAIYDVDAEEGDAFHLCDVIGNPETGNVWLSRMDHGFSYPPAHRVLKPLFLNEWERNRVRLQINPERPTFITLSLSEQDEKALAFVRDDLWQLDEQHDTLS